MQTALKEIIRTKGIKQKWLAQKMGVSEVTVSNWVKMKTAPNPEHMEKLSEILNVPAEQLKSYYGQ